MAPRKKRTSITKNSLPMNEIGQSSSSDMVLETADGNVKLDFNIFNLEKKQSSSPDANCSICLGKIRNKAFTDACIHTFCFICLRRWSKSQPVCPLCKKPFTQILHNMRSPIDFDTWDLYSQMNESSEGNTRRGAGRGRTGSRRARGGRANARVETDEYLAAEILRLGEEFRRTIYSTGMMVRELQTPDGRVLPYLDVSLTSLAADPLFELRVTPWLTREINVLLEENDANLSTYVREHIINLTRTCEITSEEFFDQLTSFFGNQTRHFIHELHSFVRAPFDRDGRLNAREDEPIRGDSSRSMEEYDAVVIYHLSDELNSEESDVEIIPPLILEARPGRSSSLNRSSEHFYHENHSRYDLFDYDSSSNSPIYVPDEQNLFHRRNDGTRWQSEDGDWPRLASRGFVRDFCTVRPRCGSGKKTNGSSTVELINLDEPSDDANAAILLSSSDDEEVCDRQETGSLKRRNEYSNDEDNLRDSKKRRLLFPPAHERFVSAAEERNLDNDTRLRPKFVDRFKATDDVELYANTSDKIETDENSKSSNVFQVDSFDDDISEYLQTNSSVRRNDALVNWYDDRLQNDAPETSIDRRRRKLQLIRDSYFRAREPADVSVITKNYFWGLKSDKVDAGDPDVENCGSDVEIVSNEIMQTKPVNGRRGMNKYKTVEPCIDVTSDSDDDDCAIVNGTNVFEDNVESIRLSADDEDAIDNDLKQRTNNPESEKRSASTSAGSDKIREGYNGEPLLISDGGESGCTSNKRSNRDEKLSQRPVSSLRNKSVITASQSFEGNVFKKHHTGHKKSSAFANNKLKRLTEMEISENNIPQQSIDNIAVVNKEMKPEVARLPGGVEVIAPFDHNNDNTIEPACTEHLAKFEQPAMIEQEITVQQLTMDEQPAVIEQEIMVKQPSIGEQPAVIEQEIMVEQPSIGEQPAVIEQEIMVKQPTTDEKPAMIEQEIMVKQPTTGEEPAMFEQEITIKQPTAGEHPAMIKQPTSVEHLVMNEHLVAMIEQPATIEQLAIVEQPVTTEQPAAIERDLDVVIKSPTDPACTVTETKRKNEAEVMDCGIKGAGINTNKTIIETFSDTERVIVNDVEPNAGDMESKVTETRGDEIDATVIEANVAEVDPKLCKTKVDKIEMTVMEIKVDKLDAAVIKAKFAEVEPKMSEMNSKDDEIRRSKIENKIDEKMQGSRMEIDYIDNNLINVTDDVVIVSDKIKLDEIKTLRSRNIMRVSDTEIRSTDGGDTMTRENKTIDDDINAPANDLLRSSEPSDEIPDPSSNTTSFNNDEVLIDEVSSDESSPRQNHLFFERANEIQGNSEFNDDATCTDTHSTKIIVPVSNNGTSGLTPRTVEVSSH